VPKASTAAIRQNLWRELRLEKPQLRLPGWSCGFSISLLDLDARRF